MNICYYATGSASWKVLSSDIRVKEEQTLIKTQRYDTKKQMISTGQCTVYITIDRCSNELETMSLSAEFVFTWTTVPHIEKIMIVFQGTWDNPGFCRVCIAQFIVFYVAIMDC